MPFWYIFYIGISISANRCQIDIDPMLFCSPQYKISLILQNRIHINATSAAISSQHQNAGVEVKSKWHFSLRWRHNDHAGVSNHQPHGCLLNRLFRRKSRKTSKLRATGLCAGNSPGTGEFPAQMASYAENVSIWWRHHVTWCCCWKII